MSGRPLEGVTVVGVEHSVAGPLCTRILAELGADVLKVERPPRGDFARHWDDHADGDSGQFWWLNRAKRGAALALGDPADRERLAQALAAADVLVCNMAPAAAARAGLDAATLAAAYPRLIVCQISGYGADGSGARRKAYDMLVQAEAGLMSVTGTPEQPGRTGVSICDVSTGIQAALLVLAALRERDRTGRGRHLDVAMFDCALEFVAPMLTSYANAGVLYERSLTQHHAIAPYGVFGCAGGRPVVLAIEQDAEWRRFCAEVIDSPRLAADPRFATNAGRVAGRDELAGLIAERLAALERDAVVVRLERAGIAFGAVNDMRDLVAHPLLAERRLLATARSADAKPITTFAGVAARAFGRTLDQPPPALAPTADTEDA